MTTFQLRLLVLAMFAYFIAVFLFSDVRRAYVVGGDDGVELAKALTLHRSPEESRAMWNDQPWLSTMLISKLFAVFGEKVWVPRLLSMGSALALLVVLVWNYKRHLSFAGLISLPVFLLSADEFNYMAFSGMVEVPAISLAVISAVLFQKATTSKHKALACLAGLLFACAINIKFTSLIVAPVFLVLLIQSRSSRQILFLFAISWVAAMAGLAFASPSFNLAYLFGTHSETRAVLQRSGSADKFQIVYLIQNPALLIAGIAGAYSLRKKANIGLIPVVMLVSAICLSLFHKPWWKFYLIHYMVPLSVLAAFGVDACWRTLVASEHPDLQRNAFRSGLRNAVGLLILCAWSAFAVPSYLDTMDGRVFNRHAVEEVEVVRVADFFRRRSGSDWCYSLSGDLAFSSGLAIPAKWTVITLKRLLVTKESIDSMAAGVRDSKLPILILKKDAELLSDSWLAWLTNSYSFVGQSAFSEVWIRQGLFEQNIGLAPEQSDGRISHVF